jgi:biotin-(acetyl-CoA carboxylase) ligase
MEMDAVDYMVIGWGVNVNTPAAGFPEAPRPRPPASFHRDGRPFSPGGVLRRIHWRPFETHYQAFGASGFPRSWPGGRPSPTWWADPWRSRPRAAATRAR